MKNLFKVFTPPHIQVNMSRAPKGFSRLLILTLMCLATNVGMADTSTFIVANYTYQGLQGLQTDVSQRTSDNGNTYNAGKLQLGDNYYTIKFSDCQIESNDNNNNRAATIKALKGSTIYITPTSTNGWNAYTTKVVFTLASLDASKNKLDSEEIGKNGVGTSTSNTSNSTITFTYSINNMCFDTYTVSTDAVQITKIEITYNRQQTVSTPEVPAVFYEATGNGATFTEGEDFKGDYVQVRMAPNGYQNPNQYPSYSSWASVTDYEIYYTFDDTKEPTEMNQYVPAATPYKGTIQVTQDMTIKMAVWDKRKLKWGAKKELKIAFEPKIVKKYSIGEPIKAEEPYPITDQGKQVLITSFGRGIPNEGDYLDKDGKTQSSTPFKEWSDAKTETSQNMNYSQFTGFEIFSGAQDDAEGENKWNYEKNGGKGGYDESRYKYNGERDFNDLNTFDIPITGAYFKFEPKVDGQISVIVRQNGIWGSDGMEMSKEQGKVVKRYAFVCDETGKPLKDLKGMLSSKALLDGKIFAFGTVHDKYSGISFDPVYDDNGNLLQTAADSWDKLHDCMIELYSDNFDVSDYLNSDGEIDKEKVLPLAKTQWETWADQYILLPDKTTNGSVTVQYKNQKDEDGKPGSTGQANSNNNNTCDLSNVLVKDNYGCYVLGKSYVRYTFPVKAGKTYFMMGRWTKLGIAGYSFKRNISDDNAWNTFMADRKVTIDATSTGANVELPNAFDPKEHKMEGDSGDLEVIATSGEHNITLNREFKEGVWTSLVLPFSISPSAVKEAFGNDALIVHFNRVETVETAEKITNTLYLTQHYHQMIVAGTPVFIKPSKTVSNVIITGAYEYKKGTNEIPIWKMDGKTPTGGTGWHIEGSYTPEEVPVGAYIMGYKESNGNVTDNGLVRITKPTTVAGTRAWIVNSENAEAKLTSFAINGIEDDATTAIGEILLGEEPATMKGIRATGVYNLNGQMVRENTTDTTGLPAGIYIAGGRKVVVK